MSTYNVVPKPDPNNRPATPREPMPVKARGGGGMLATPLLVLLGIALFILIFANPLVTVGAGKRAVVFSLKGGTLSGQLDEGLHLVTPFVQSIVLYDVRTQTYTMSATSWEGELKGDDSLTALTNDGQVVKIDISVRFHPDATKIYQIHQKVGPDFANKIIRPAVRSQVRVVIAQFPVNDVYATKREEIERRIEVNLKKSLAENNIVLDEVLLRDVRFSDAFAQAIEQKQIAQQNAQRMQYVLQKAEKEKQQKILQAQGDARSIELRGQAIAQNSRVVQYEYARKIAPNVGAIITDGRGINVPFSNAPAGR
ncbi:MAG TPA: SPFH domain-containing protein [Abditibacteriaceae bacterium]|jgi:regulator of protease activity HflC (stomatin/prohibitin superfamily)|nr:SPFH domain-containing protein [Abditibacteriaceae bacterium]